MNKRKFGIKRRDGINKKLAAQILLSLFLVAAVISIKQIDTGFSNQFIKQAEEKVNESIDAETVQHSLINTFSELKEKMPFIGKKQKEFAAPVNGKIHIKYGMVKNNEESYYNHGLDIMSKNESVKSISDGKVVLVGNNEKLANYVVVEGNDKKIIYGNIGETLVQNGDKVSQGEIIGALNEENKILHLEVWENGESLNPAKLFDISD